MSIPIPRVFWPIVITNANNLLRFQADATGVAADEYRGYLTTGTYVTPEALATQLVTNLKACVGQVSTTAYSVDGGDASVSISADGYISITLSGQDNGFSSYMRWADTAETQALAAVLGYTASNTTQTTASNAATFTAQNQITNLWTPGTPARSDTEDVTDYAVTQSVAQGGQSYTTRHGDRARRVIEFECLAPERVFIIDETADNTALERFISGDGVGKFRYSPDRSSPATDAADYYVLKESLETFAPERMYDGLRVYRFTLRMGAYVA